MMPDNLQGSRISGGNTAYKRSVSDFYPTPPEATQALLNFLRLLEGTKVWEPACGEGHMVEVMEQNRLEVIGTDIQTGTDFLQAEIPNGVQWIITNHPFSLAEQFIRRCIQHKKPFALLLKSQYWHAKKRLELFRQYPPSFICPLTWRPDFMLGKRGCGSPLIDVMWVIWGETHDTRYVPLEKPILNDTTTEMEVGQ